MNRMHFDAVIIGSGFGGSVMAYRLAEAGLRVCLLERGKPYPPGSFPRTPHQMKHNFWDPSEGLYGLYNVWSFDKLSAVVSSGLGGGSLIYSNVLIRKDEKWFVKEDAVKGGYEYWPLTRVDIDPHYERVEKMLHGQRYPFDCSPYDKTGRTIALKSAAEQLHLDWYLPKLAVTFANKGEAPVPGVTIHEIHPNLHGPDAIRDTCRLCGECNIGCNFGSKNTLDYTYLSEAKRLGAEIHTGCEARSFEPSGSGYVISYVEHDMQREGQKMDTHDPAVLPPKTITADRLILSAGAFGTVYLLLKNLGAFPHISAKLGTHFTGNGDFVSLAQRCSSTVDGKRVPRVIEAMDGPAITSTIRIPDVEDGGTGRGFYIQDAGYPNFVNWVLQLFDIPNTLGEWFHVGAHLLLQWIKGDAETDLGAHFSRLFGNSELSAGLMPMGGMGRDIPTGLMRLQNGRLQVDWNEEQSESYYHRVRDQMRAITQALGGEFVDTPLWYLNRVVTVHPLGGCPMGRDSTEGIVNSSGEVFHYPGFYIADGSVMPGPVGANPSLTIAALADRFADGIIEAHKRRAQMNMPSTQG